MFKGALSIFFAIFVAVAGAFADQVSLRNGDRLSGSIMSSNREIMTMKTEYLGDVTIQWDAIEEITSEEQLFVTSSDGQVLVGSVSTSGGEFIVRTAQGSTVSIGKAVVESIRSPEEQASYEAEVERLRNPNLLDFWSGFVDVGLSLTKGNAETNTFSTAMKTERKTQRDKISVYANSLFAQNSTTGVSETTANAIRGGTRYDMNLNGNLFTFGFLDLEFDEFQNLDLRNVIGGGLGWHVKDSGRVIFDFYSGGSFNQEFFSTDLTRRSAELVFGEELTYKILESTSISEKLSIYPNLSETGEYRVQFDSTLSTELSSWLAWHFTLSDRFLSNPIPTVKKNDVLLTTGIRLSFGEAGL